ncbi:MAG: hypothetical protein HY365_00960 [Candidatus Aenigmarchaeota archaeon]|nr:hypothetical protein [Candidatus Aenigmarchaeota archaeon]
MKNAILVTVLFVLSAFSYASILDDVRGFVGGIFSDPTGYTVASSNNQIVLTLSDTALTQDFVVGEDTYQVRLAVLSGKVATIVLNRKTGDGRYTVLDSSIMLNERDIHKTKQGFAIELTKVALYTPPKSDTAFNGVVTLTILTPTKLSMPWPLYKLVSFAATKDEMKDMAKLCGNAMQIKAIHYPNPSPVIFDTWAGIEPLEEMKFGTLYQIYSDKCKDISILPDSPSSVTLNAGNNYIASTFPIKQQEAEIVCGRGTLDTVVLWAPINSLRATYKTSSSMILTMFPMAGNVFRYVDEIEPYMGYIINFKPNDGNPCTITYDSLQQLESQKRWTPVGGTCTGKYQDEAGGMSYESENACNAAMKKLDAEEVARRGMAPPLPDIPAADFESSPKDTSNSIVLETGINAIGVSKEHAQKLFGSCPVRSFKGGSGILVESPASRDSPRQRSTALVDTAVTMQSVKTKDDMEALFTFKNIVNVLPALVPVDGSCTLDIPANGFMYATLKRGTNFFTSVVSLPKDDVQNLLTACAGENSKIVPVEGGTANKPFVIIDKNGAKNPADVVLPFKAYFIGVETGEGNDKVCGKIDGNGPTCNNRNSDEGKKIIDQKDEFSEEGASQCEFNVYNLVNRYGFCERDSACADGKVYMSKTAAGVTTTTASRNTPKITGAPVISKTTVNLPVALAAGDKLTYYNDHTPGISLQNNKIIITRGSYTIEAGVKRMESKTDSVTVEVNKINLKAAGRSMETSVGLATVSVAAELSELDTNAVITVKAFRPPSDNEKSAFEKAAGSDNKITAYAYTAEISKTGLDEITLSYIDMTANKAFGDKYGLSKIKIMRKTGDKVTILGTAVRGSDPEGSVIFRGTTDTLSGVFALVVLEQLPPP